MATSFDFAIENEADFRRQLEKLGDVTADFRIPFNLIANDFYISQRKIFGLKGPGKYVDLKEKTKEQYIS